MRLRRLLPIGCALLAPACVVREYRPTPPPPVVYQAPPPAAYQPPPPPADVEVSSVYVDPPVDQPPAVAIPYAPPPMRWDPPPPQPYVDVVWVGGHWTWWDGEWVWARGHWARAPRPNYVYCEPYYEYRGEVVVFVPGFWRPVTHVFVPPPMAAYVPVVQVRVVHAGYARPVGPHGVFVPAPPGSTPGVIVPAPVGTPPAVVLSAPPVVRPGMVVRPVPTRGVVEVVAPAGVTREGRPVTAQAPTVAHDAASVHPVVVAPPPPVRRTPGRVEIDRVPAPSAGVSPGPQALPSPSASTPAPIRPGAASPEADRREGPEVVVRRPVPPSGPAGEPPLRPVLRPTPDVDRRGTPRPSPSDRVDAQEPMLRPAPAPRTASPAQPSPARAPVARAQSTPSRPAQAHPVEKVPAEERKHRPEPGDR